jgi:serine protease Do
VSLEGVIQTDAAITEGSSGGALLDWQGRLIGVTTAVGVSSVGVEGIGFAIPVETVMAAVTALQGSRTFLRIRSDSSQIPYVGSKAR